MMHSKQISVDDAARGRRRHLFSMTSSSEYLLSSSKHGIIGVSVDRTTAVGVAAGRLRRSLQIVERGETVTAGGVPARRPPPGARPVHRQRDAAAVRLHVPLRKRRRRCGGGVV